MLNEKKTHIKAPMLIAGQQRQTIIRPHGQFSQRMILDLEEAEKTHRETALG